MPKFESEDLYTENKKSRPCMFCFNYGRLLYNQYMGVYKGVWGVRTPFCRQMTFSE